MKFRGFLLNLTVGLFALFFGLFWVGVFQFFAGSLYTVTQSCPLSQQKVEVAAVEKPNFDINDPNSVLPLDYEEDKLTSPKADETNEAYFDPEGYYSFLGDVPMEFEDFHFISIQNKRLDVSPKSEHFGEAIPPKGYVLLEGTNDAEYIDFKNIEISDGKINFQTETREGIS